MLKSLRPGISSIFLLLLVIVFSTAWVLIDKGDQSQFLEKRAELVVREVGHNLLLHAGDSTSRVLPVRQLSKGIFQVEFENAFSFVPDTLAAIVQRNLASGDLPLQYMVQVFDCSNHDMVYGFEIRPDKTDIKPCMGRVQPSGCYTIQISFFELAKADSKQGVYLLAGLALLGLTMLAFIGWPRTKRMQAVCAPKCETILLGNYEFDSKLGLLKFGTESISLSNKEVKILSLLAANLNQLTDRDMLVKEIWENEGVITGRSLDVFVSKLRKKLSQDTSIRITNTHGKGYKLELG